MAQTHIDRPDTGNAEPAQASAIDGITAPVSAEVTDVAPITLPAPNRRIGRRVAGGAASLLFLTLGSYLAVRAGINKGEQDALSSIPPVTAGPLPGVEITPSTTEAPTTTTTVSQTEIDPTTGLLPGAVENPSIETAPEPPLQNADGTFGRYPEGVPIPAYRDEAGAQAFISNWLQYREYIVNNAYVEGSGAIELMEEIGIPQVSELGQSILEGAQGVQNQRQADPSYTLSFRGLLINPENIDFTAIQPVFESVISTYEHTSSGINVYKQHANWVPMDVAASSGLQAQISELTFTHDFGLVDQG